MAGLDSLLPAYRDQYTALEPEIERKVNADLIKRGAYYSGGGADAMARAKAELLAELAAKSATAQTSTDEAAKDRNERMALADAARKEARRAQNMGLVSSGLGAAATLAMLRGANAGAAANIFKSGDQFLTFDPKTGSLVPVPVQGQGVVGTPAAGGAGPALTVGPNGEMQVGAGANRGGLSMLQGTGATQVAAPVQPSMWQKVGGWGGMGAGLAGGLLGRNMAGSLGGETNQGTDIGAGLGGLAGLLAAGKYGIPGMAQGSPWAAGLGALLGSTGGGLLGGLFK